MLRTALTLLAQQTPEYHYWWLGLASPFGGRNYNLEEVQRGEHISNSSTGGGGRGGRAGRNRGRKFSKRQSEDTAISADSEDIIKLNEIDTECPRLSHCVPRFFCDKFRGETPLDQIPCLLTTGQFKGQFGICCQDEFSRKCPLVGVSPPPSQCVPRPLGQPEDHQCGRPGERDRCEGDQALCCFNGCLNVCLSDPPYSIQKSLFIREKAFIVSPDGGLSPSPSQPESGEEFNSSGDYDDEADYSGDGDYQDFISPRRTPRSRSVSSEEAELSSLRLARILKRLLHKLRDRIS